MYGGAELKEIIDDFGTALVLADALHPQAPVSRSGNTYRPGVGPHRESDTIRLVIEAARRTGDNCMARFRTSVPYPNLPQKRCDLVCDPPTPWALECKMARFLGDNGKVANTSVADFLSPYETDRSALTDCTKLLQSGFQARLGILVFTFESEEWSAEPLLEAFETLAQDRVSLGPRVTTSYRGLVHPVHQFGQVCGWEVLN